MIYYVLGIVAVAFIFDFINGFHDSANSIATVVATRVLSPGVAVMWAAFFNFIAAFVFTTAVAKTIGSGLIDLNIVTPNVILAGLLGAIIWDLVTWYYGLPSSSSHALIGGYAGAALAKAGLAALVLGRKWIETISFIVISPLFGMILGFALMVLVFWIFRKARPRSVDKWFRLGQLASSAAYSIGHGGNDAQKTMGIIVALLIASGHMTKDFDHIPMWIVVSSYGCMALGTAMGGWRIVKTMGMRLTKLRPVGGFCAEMAGAATLFGATHLHIPVSTTHTITGAIIGVGSTTKMRGIRWGLASRIVWAWIFTIPLSAGMASGTFLLFQQLSLW